MDQQAVLFQNLIDSVKSLTSEVSQLRSKVFTLEKENKELKEKLIGDILMSKLAPIPLEHSRDEYPEDPKYEFEVSEFEQILNKSLMKNRKRLTIIGKRWSINGR